MPRPPSMLARIAVSSPQTKAPAPILMVMSKSTSVPRMLRPSSPAARHWRMASLRRSIASGYSARQYT